MCKFLCFIIIFSTCNAHSLIPQLEKDALITLYNATNGDNWTEKSNWLQGDPCDNSWYGITCEENSIIGIDLGSQPGSFIGNNLVGEIPIEIQNLINLETLLLNDNQIHGAIPIELGNLQNLKRLYLAGNQLTGTIPPELGNLSNLQSLWLLENQLTGSIPSELGNLTQLNFLRLHSNRLTGEIPSDLGNPNSLVLFTIDLSNNLLTGDIPETFGNLFGLEILNLSNNQLTGGIDAVLGNLINLRTLDLSSNQLNGSISSSIGNLTNLQKIDFSRNFNLSTNQSLSWLGNLTNLMYLDLGFCYSLFINDEVPSEIGNLTNLKHLGFFSYYGLFRDTTYEFPTWMENLTQLTYLEFYMSLNGELPQWLENLTLLERIRIRNYSNIYLDTSTVDLSKLNNLTYLGLINIVSGVVPSWISGMNQLETLQLSNNNFIGETLPVWLSNLPNLKNIYIGNSKLTGNIPTEIGSLDNLENVFLNGNQLLGVIPEEIGNLNLLKNLDLAENKLSGTLPFSIGGMTSLETLSINSNKLSGVIPSSIANLQNMIRIDTRYNGLYSDNTIVDDFINSYPCLSSSPYCNADWKASQTLYPQNIEILAKSNNSISLIWDESSYQQQGHYKILMSDSQSGPFTEIYQTNSKNEVAYTVGNLTPNQAYYFKLITLTEAHAENHNIVTSEDSQIINEITDLNSDSADLFVDFENSNNQDQSLSRSGDDEYSELSYKIIVGNNGPTDVINSTFIHKFPDGLISFNWICQNLSGDAVCTKNNGSEDIGFLLDLSANSSLEIIVNGEFDGINEGDLILVASVIPSNGIADTDLSSNVSSFNFDLIFKNSFEISK
ncbi:MAG: leucine-rich repeat domain-containing protein [Marinicellaceae bacterium]